MIRRNYGRSKLKPELPKDNSIDQLVILIIGVLLIILGVGIVVQGY